MLAFLNQVQASHRPALAWFLEIALVHTSYVSAPEGINNKWHDMVLYWPCVIG